MFYLTAYYNSPYVASCLTTSVIPSLNDYNFDRYATTQDKWAKSKLTYYVENISDTLDYRYTHAEIVRAFEVENNKVQP